MTLPAQPNLFIAGAPKCGTTALWHWLAGHSAVFVSPKKEPHHFGDEYQLTHSREKYEAFFQGAAPSAKWLCEASVWYMYSPSAVSNILKYNPQSRFIAMVRNPLGMVPSMHRQQVFNGNELITDLDRAIEANDQRLAGNPIGVFSGYPPDHLAYLHSCALGWQVERIKTLVPDNQLHIVLYDDFADNPEKEYRGVIEFLGLEPEPPDSFKRINVAKARKYPALDRLARSVIEFRKRNNIKLRLGITSLMRKWNKMEQPITPLTREQRRLLANAFQADVELLEKTLGRSLSHWLEADLK